MSFILEEGKKIIDHLTYIFDRTLHKEEVMILSEFILMYGSEEVLTASILGSTRYLKFSDDTDRPTEESIALFWDKLGGILYNRSRPAQ